MRIHWNGTQRHGPDTGTSGYFRTQCPHPPPGHRFAFKWDPSNLHRTFAIFTLDKQRPPLYNQIEAGDRGGIAKSPNRRNAELWNCQGSGAATAARQPLAGSASNKECRVCVCVRATQGPNRAFFSMFIFAKWPFQRIIQALLGKSEIRATIYHTP